jgi:addiction module HigA family antidote
MPTSTTEIGLPRNRLPTHPGEVLLEEFLAPLGVTQVAFARHLGIPLQRLNEIVRGKRGVTPATAWLLAQALGTTPQLWMNLQSNYDLALNRPAVAIGTLVSAPEASPQAV